MAVQEWTIFKIVGPAATQTETHLSRLAKSRTTNDRTSWTTSEWPARSCQSAARLIEALTQNRACAHVAYFSTHKDGWSSFGELFQFIPHSPPSVAYDDSDVWSYRLPDRGRLIRRARRAIFTHQFQETLWLANTFQAAASAYRKLWYEALLIIHRRACGPSRTDEELLSEARNPIVFATT